MPRRNASSPQETDGWMPYGRTCAVMGLFRVPSHVRRWMVGLLLTSTLMWLVLGLVGHGQRAVIVERTGQELTVSFLTYAALFYAVSVFRLRDAPQVAAILATGLVLGALVMLTGWHEIILAQASRRLLAAEVLFGWCVLGLLLYLWVERRSVWRVVTFVLRPRGWPITAAALLLAVSLNAEVFATMGLDARYLSVVRHALRVDAALIMTIGGWLVWGRLYSPNGQNPLRGRDR